MSIHELSRETMLNIVDHLPWKDFRNIAQTNATLYSWLNPIYEARHIAHLVFHHLNVHRGHQTPFDLPLSIQDRPPPANDVFFDLLEDSMQTLNAGNRARVLQTRQCLADALANPSTDLNAKDANKRTPLMYAIQMSSATLVRALLAAGADVNHRDRFGVSPALQAAEIVAETIRELLFSPSRNMCLYHGICYTCTTQSRRMMLYSQLRSLRHAPEQDKRALLRTLMVECKEAGQVLSALLDVGVDLGEVDREMIRLADLVTERVRRARDWERAYYIVDVWNQMR